ncbi:PIN domain-containing protein [Nocardia sp. NPDC055053]
MGELRRGIDHLPDGKRRARLERWLAEELPARFERRLLPADVNVVLDWGACRVSADRAGRPIDPVDALIAATAITHRLTVATRNVRLFQAVDVPVICPWEGC